MLLNMFEFTESDLNSNRMGLISTRQQEQLNQFAGGIRKSQWTSVWVIGFFLIFGLCLIFSMYLSNESTREALFSNPFNFVAILAVIPIVTVIVAFGIFLANRRANKLSEPKLQEVEGKVEFEEEYERHAGTVYYLLIGDEEFSFSEKIDTLFEEGASYRIFFCEAPYIKYILSYEKIG